MVVFIVTAVRTSNVSCLIYFFNFEKTSTDQDSNLGLDATEFESRSEEIFSSPNTSIPNLWYTRLHFNGHRFFSGGKAAGTLR
jgi:hypothetical protein